MITLRSFFARLRDFFRRDRMEAGLREDLEFHLSELESRFLAQGMSPEDAKAAARRELGNLTRVQEDFHEQAGFPVLEEFARDFAVAFRGLAKRPVFSLGIVLILALGLGIAATVQGLASAIFSKPLPVNRPEEIHLVVNPDSKPALLSRGTANRLAEDFGADKVAIYSSNSRVVVRIGGKSAFNSACELVNGGFFSVLGVGAQAGRMLQPDDESSPDKAKVIVVSHGWALRNFGSPEKAVDKEVQINRTIARIVGVAPESFGGILVGRQTDLWMPAAVQPAIEFSSDSRSNTSSDRPNDNNWNREERVSWVYAFIRLRSGADLTAAATRVVHAYHIQGEDLAKALGDSAAQEQARKRTFGVLPAPAGYSSFRKEYQSTNAALTAFVGVFLLLASANVSGLLLVRGLSRQREIGVRLALGAKRWRIFFLLGMESLILSLGGALCGLLLASWLLPASAALLVPNQKLGALGIDLGLFGAITLLALFIALLCSLLPSYFLTRLQPQDAILGNGRLGRSPAAAGRGLVVLQLASAVVLLAMAVALGDNLARTLAMDPGFSSTRVLASDFDPGAGGYGSDELPQLKQRLEESLLAVPQVESVTFALAGLASGSRSQSGFYFRGEDARVRSASIQNEAVPPGFFKTAGIMLRSGRDFDGTDKEGAPITAIVSLSLARRIFGTDDVVGRRFGFGPEPAPDDCVIVGVVGDARINGLREEAPDMVYFSQTQWPRFLPGSVHVRLRGPSPGVEKTLQEVVGRIEPGLVFSRWETIDERLANELVGARGASRMSYALAFAALLLAATGMGALTAYLVTQRSREFAVRMAVGADPVHIRRGVVTDCLRLGVMGIVLGLLLAWGFHALPAIASRLPSTPGLVSSSIAALLCFGAIAFAGWLPAMRAAKTDPLQLLKSD